MIRFEIECARVGTGFAIIRAWSGFEFVLINDVIRRVHVAKNPFLKMMIPLLT